MTGGGKSALASWRRKRRSGQRGGAVKSVLLFLAGLAALAAAALGVGGWLGYRAATEPGPASDAVIVLLPHGSAVSTIAQQLEDEGVIKHPEIFIAAVRIRGVQGEIKAGEYEIPARSSVMEIIDQLMEGKSILHYFTAPEGLTTAQIIRLLNADEVLEGEVTLEPGEGELLPETFAYTRGETRDGLLRRMMKDQDALLDEIWDERAMELPFSTQGEAIILASIVEKETGVPEERARIAAVFVNRLKRGMRLESDPTIIYGLTEGEPLGRGLRVSELRKETPYNTYIIRGLPPTPIANPGAASIKAVLNPADTDDIFFVADGTGGHVFSSTLREHNANVAKWRTIERQRKGRQ
ncbi:endolytic transglycosylase MltG [Marinicaulis flavus]|uniref:Endolytic murein transglycosylase n=1 Tax=Hyphococcus luteus TaxID=2058213 RepID=A0A2S7JZL2_9PROT|nr:endolytic transglycosylase MltG [Marinicaulis flavus]